MGVITAQHQGLDAQLVQLGQRHAATVPNGIGDGKQTLHLTLDHQQHHTLALRLQVGQRQFPHRFAQPQLLQQPLVAEITRQAANHAAHSPPR